MTTVELWALAWPVDRCGDALEGLASTHGGLGAVARELPRPVGLEPTELPSWIDQCAEALGIEAEPLFVDYGTLESIIRRAGPVLLVVPVDEDHELCIAILESKGRHVRLLTPELQTRLVPAEALFRALTSSLEASVLQEIERPLAALSLPKARRAVLISSLVAERLGSRRFGQGWLLRRPPRGGLWAAVKHGGVASKAAAFLGAHLLQHGLGVLAWWILGISALRGTLESGWLSAWVVLVIVMLSIQAGTTWLSTLLSIDTGSILKRQLLLGAMSSALGSVRRKGAGEAFGSIYEAESIDRLARVGGLMGAMSIAELAVAGLVLGSGRAGAALVALLVGWVGLTAWLTRRYMARYRAWASDRVSMTNELVEAMIGQRTRLAQEDADRWHVAEDRMLARYLERGSTLDRATSALVALVPRGWVLVAMLGLVPSLVLDDAAALEPTAIALGGVLLAYRALAHLVSSLHQLAGAADAWRRSRPLFDLAAVHTLSCAPRRDGTGERDRVALVAAHELVFRHVGRAEPVLHRCDLRIDPGDRILLEGSSGSGKSTLASLLAGLGAPSAGLLLLHGRDLRSTGITWWRRRVVLVPQFHDNYILNGSLALNLLCGTDWPVSGRQIGRAVEVCEELGLGPLLARMPMGMQQLVGETGWQLSHGERSRVYIARALLQDPALIILDESFAALDPNTLELAIACVRRRARTLMVIAHP